jgi:hypothetical protein
MQKRKMITSETLVGMSPCADCCYLSFSPAIRCYSKNLMRGLVYRVYTQNRIIFGRSVPDERSSLLITHVDLNSIV